jgi:hypothetical protein
LISKRQQYASEVGTNSFKRIEAVGDIRSKHITPKDTEMFQISAREGSKSYKKYFLASQYTVSNLQSNSDSESVVAQVLDEQQKHQDELVLFGEGTAANNVVNNGLFWSGDANYALESSVEVSSTDRMYALHNLVMVNKAKADLVEGRKALVYYGSLTLPLFNGLFPSAAVPFKSSLQAALGGDYSVIQMPSAITMPSSGWMIVNLDQVKLHYTELPSLNAQGFNEEKGYYWYNFLQGSTMVEVLAPNAIVRQPITLAA